MSSIRDEMPLLTRHEGEWTGIYTILDAEGNMLDKHKSILTCEFPENGEYPYYQMNKYIWPEGKYEEHHFPATYHDQKIWFDTERLEGYAWEVDDSIIMLWFKYKAMPGAYMYEMIHLSPCGNYRNRTLHWFKDDRVFKRTTMQEERVKK
ncbi:DUF3598 family protein [Argonema galeatum]|uniref:DUF3598 family protein n=1 Tax=Argonema galeatum TaxID=2942762 RepID=UPI0020121454|nr:DUF3598 family protein [Argonema galeatum]MCL1464535.1 DUF3598 domain-containing protein [Argonema galeatum A003/A1]